MTRRSVPLPSGTYDTGGHQSAQDVVGFIPVPAEQEGTMTPASLVQFPGLRPWVLVYAEQTAEPL